MINYTHLIWGTRTLGWFKTPVSSQTHKLMAGTKFSDYLGLKHYKKAKKIKHFIHLVSLILSCQKLNPRLLREVTYYH
jgi:hypothetical protein